MMTLGQVIELLKGIFEMLVEYLGPLFQKDEEGDETTAEA